MNALKCPKCNGDITDVEVISEVSELANINYGDNTIQDYTDDEIMDTIKVCHADGGHCFEDITNFLIENGVDVGTLSPRSPFYTGNPEFA